MKVSNRGKYSTQQWKFLFSTLFISTTLVLILLLIALNILFSSQSITALILPKGESNQALSSLNNLATLLVIASAVISWAFSYLTIKSVFYAKRKHIYFMKLTGIAKGYILRKYSTAVAWCSLASGVATIIIIGSTAFALSLFGVNLLMNINIDGLFISFIIIPIWAILINGINSLLVITSYYRQSKKQIFSI